MGAACIIFGVMSIATYYRKEQFGSLIWDISAADLEED
jgi:hypothetical protein